MDSAIVNPRPKISIIIPAYNAEAFIGRCIDSILVQAQKDFEIIIVDDGSTDGTIHICDGYAEKDPRVRVAHKENGGASSARNIGLDLARGEWVVFIDADDYIEGMFFPSSFDNETDMYVQNWKFTGSEGQTEALDAQVVPQDGLNAFWHAHFHWDLFRSVCCKFIRKSILDKYRIRFDSRQRLGEDTLFFMDYIRYCRQIQVLDTGLYIYDRQDFNWNIKYDLSLDDILSYFHAFLDRYDRLPVGLPHLADFEYSFFTGFLTEADRKKNAWRFSKAVLRMKELRARVCNPPFLYRGRLLLLIIISRVLGKYD